MLSEVYMPDKGAWEELSGLDVMQMLLGSVPVVPRPRSVPRGGVLGAKKMLLLFLGETGEGAGQL